MKNILFYKYVPMSDLESFKAQHLELCKSLELKGRVLIAEEGINGNLSGSEENTERYMETMRDDPRFSDMEFKEGFTDEHDFKKMVVKIKKEIVTSRFGVDVQDKGTYLEPEELKKMYENNEEFFIIDARNDYEVKIGKFKNAINPAIRTFSQFPKAVEKLDHLKEKKVVTYCTGGIRCEKASAYLKKAGFKNVYQVHGGILNYGKECSNENWEGKCFVFDSRGAVEIDPNKQTEPISQCTSCAIPSDDCTNCANLKCDERIILCEQCIPALNNCCSKRCRNEMAKNPELANPDIIKEISCV